MNWSSISKAANLNSETDNHLLKKRSFCGSDRKWVSGNMFPGLPRRPPTPAGHSRDYPSVFFSNEMGSFHKDTCQVVKFRVSQSITPDR